MIYAVYTVAPQTVCVAHTADRTRAEEEYQRIRTYSPPTVRTIGRTTRPAKLAEVLRGLTDRFPGRAVAVRPI